MFGPEYENEINEIPLSDNTIARRITDLFEDSEGHVKMS